MGQKDLSQKHLESYPDVFADVVNALELIPEFQGREDVGVCELLDKYENRGMKKGLKKGEETTLVANIKALMETMGLTMDKAMEALKVPEKKRAYYAKKVQG